MPAPEMRPVVLLAQVGSNHMLQAARVDLPQQRRRLPILQVAKAPADTLLELRRIARGGERFRVRIALQNKAVAEPQHVDDMRGDRTAVGEHAKTAITHR